MSTCRQRKPTSFTLARKDFKYFELLFYELKW